EETSKDKEIDKLMALISLSFKKIYKPTNNNLRTTSNTNQTNSDNSPRINRSTGYENQRIGNVAEARETVGSTVVQKSGIQCYNCKEFGHVARECQKPKRVKDDAYHREKMLLYKQEEAGIQLNAEQVDWRDDTDDDESQDQELEAHYMYMAQIQEVSLDTADSGPIFDVEPVQKVSTDDHYNLFAIKSEHPEKSESIHDTYLEVAFRRNACFFRNLEGVDLLKGLPKFKKEHLCPSCEQGKSKRASHPPKPVPNSRQRLHLLYMDLCGPMRIASINGKRYILVIVDDYSRYTWVHFLRSKDEAPEVNINFLKRITVLLQSPIIIIRTDNGTEFKNQVLKVYFDSVGISHQMSSVRTPQQNGVVERRNRTLVEAARTMLIFSRAPLFLWAEAIATSCFTQNRSIIHR
nr:putative ribonuclease H-like domain-containing protein [Tanacetum cinerariifolium]